MMQNKFLLLVLHVTFSTVTVMGFTIGGIVNDRGLRGKLFSSIQEEETQCVVILKQYEVTLRKPIGMTLESDEEDPGAGIIIKRIDPQGLTAVMCKSEPDNYDICIRDKILNVNGKDVGNKSYENVMQMISDGPDEVRLSLGRPSDAVVIRWNNGISVAAKPGDPVKEIARDEASVKIPYLCHSGGCGTCEQSISTGKGEVSNQTFYRKCDQLW